MLYLARTLQQLQFGKLMEVYTESNAEKEDGILQAEQEFYCYLRDCFFTTPGAVYALWQEQDAYVSALRLEPYKDGLLLAALETAPVHRNRGFAGRLVRSVLAEFAENKIYSHVSRENLPSLAVHKKCGFQKILDYATYIDGSVNRRAVTLCHYSALRR